MKQRHRWAEVIHDFAEGAKIQMRWNYNDDWVDVENPSWHEEAQYRIKPEPKPDIVVERFIYIDGAENVIVDGWGDRKNARMTFDSTTKILKHFEMIGE